MKKQAKIEELKKKYPKLGMLAESLVDEDFIHYCDYINTNNLEDAFDWEKSKEGGFYWEEVHWSIKLQEKEDALSWDFPKKMLCWYKDESKAEEYVVFHYEKSLKNPFLCFDETEPSGVGAARNAKPIPTPKVKVKEISIKEAAEIVAKYLSLIHI